MIFWILTGVIILAVILLSTESFSKWDTGIAVLETVAFLLIGVIVWGVMCLAVVGIGFWAGTNKVESHTYPLKALSGGAGTEGSFFLGSGHVDGKRVVSFIKQNRDGSFTPDQVDGKKAKVWERDGVEPSMTEVKHSAAYWWLMPEQVLFSKYEFEVPEG